MPAARLPLAIALGFMLAVGLMPRVGAADPSLDPATVEALELALEDEVKSLMFYDAVLEELGTRRPFSHVVQAEARHISALLDLFDKYGVDVPDRTYRTPFEVPGTFEEACAVARRAEIDNAALYDRLLEVVEEADIRDTFVRLAAASTERHLPAFQRCCGINDDGLTQAGSGCRAGLGAGRGQGAGKGAGCAGTGPSCCKAR